MPVPGVAGPVSRAAVPTRAVDDPSPKGMLMPSTERLPPGPVRGSSPMRGVILVAVAVVLGFFVLRAIEDTGGGPTAGEVAAEDTAPGTTGRPAPETTAPPTTRPPGQVVVLVANASGVSGAAGAAAEAVAAGGYDVLPATNAPQQVAATQILAASGYEGDAAGVATVVGAPPESVAPMPDPPLIDPAGATVVVLLGPDIANR